MAKITYQTPGIDRKTKKIVFTEKTGDVAFMSIGANRVKCVLQSNAGETADLVHFASGHIIIHATSIAARKLSHYVNTTDMINDRKAAEKILAEVVAQHGAENIMRKFEAAPTINEG